MQSFEAVSDGYLYLIISGKRVIICDSTVITFCNRDHRVDSKIGFLKEWRIKEKSLELIVSFPEGVENITFSPEDWEHDLQRPRYLAEFLFLHHVGPNYDGPDHVILVLESH